MPVNMYIHESLSLTIDQTMNVSLSRLPKLGLFFPLFFFNVRVALLGVNGRPEGLLRTLCRLGEYLPAVVEEADFLLLELKTSLSAEGEVIMESIKRPFR